MTLASRVVLACSAAALACCVGATGSAAQGLGIDFSQWQIGGMVVVAPKYEGSKSYDALGFPLLIPGGMEEGGRFSVKGIDDVRFRLLSLYGFEVGPVAGYRFGRDESDGDRLTGLGDIDGGLVLGGYVGYRAGTFLASASYGHQVTGDDDAGALLRFGIENKYRLSRSLTVTPGLGATWADGDYMSTYFGVPTAKATATRSGFDADAGFKDVNMSLSADLALDDRWTLKMMGKYSRLIGDAADSPVVETENQFFGGLGLTYRFSVGGTGR
jgi:outer membrane scaffolding protein for murein synthesis (MipA/OmpV family)